MLHSTPLHISFSTCVCFSTTITQTCTHLSVSGRHVPPNIIPHIALYAPLISPPQQCIQQKFGQEGKINMSFWWPGFHRVVDLFSKNTTALRPFSLGTRKSLPVHSKAVNLKSGSPGMLSPHFLSCAQVFCPSADPLLQPLQHWRQMFLSSILGLKAMIGGFSLWAKAPSPGSQCTSGASMNSKVLLSSFSPLFCYLVNLISSRLLNDTLGTPCPALQCTGAAHGLYGSKYYQYTFHVKKHTVL